MKISIVVPCYNEEEALPHFMQSMGAIGREMQDVTLELLFVNDGSRDGTAALLEGYASEDARVRIIGFSRNFGKEAALLAGLMHATGDYVSVMDADLQDPPELLPRMYRMLQGGDCDCVAARRVTRKGEPPIRSFFARTFYRLINYISIVRIEDGVRDFRLMRREMVDAILRLPEKRRFSKGLFAWVGFHTEYIEYENIARVAGVTKWSFWQLLRYALEGIFSMTAVPLSLPYPFALLSLIACVVLLCCGAWAAALLCGCAALVLGCMGLLGQYIARIYWEAKRRPLYILKKEKNP